MFTQMVAVLKVVLLFTGALLSVAILSQARGGGLSETFGGSASGFHRTKRGPERVLFISTIVLGVFFSVLAFVIPFTE